MRKQDRKQPKQVSISSIDSTKFAEETRRKSTQETNSRLSKLSSFQQEDYYRFKNSKLEAFLSERENRPSTQHKPDNVHEEQVKSHAAGHKRQSRDVSNKPDDAREGQVKYHAPTNKRQSRDVSINRQSRDVSNNRQPRDVFNSRQSREQRHSTKLAEVVVDKKHFRQSKIVELQREQVHVLNEAKNKSEKKRVSIEPHENRPSILYDPFNPKYAENKTSQHNLNEVKIEKPTNNILTEVPLAKNNGEKKLSDHKSSDEERNMESGEFGGSVAATVDSSLYSVLSTLKSRNTTEVHSISLNDSTLGSNSTRSNSAESQEEDNAPEKRKLSVIDEEELDHTSVYNLLGQNRTPSEFTIRATSEPQDINMLKPRHAEPCSCRTCHRERQPSMLTTYTTTSSTYKQRSMINDDYSYSDSILQSISDISTGDGSEYFTFTVIKLKPSKKTLELMNLHDMAFEEFALKWNFLKYPDKLFFLSIDEEEFIFEYERMYVFNISKSIYRYLSKCSMSLEFYVKYEHHKFKMLGIAELRLKDALREPNKMFSATLELSNKLLKICGLSGATIVYGEIQVIYSFGGDPATYEAAKFVKPPVIVIPPKGDGSYRNLLETQVHTIFKPDLQKLDAIELKAFQTGLNLTLIRNAALKVTPEDISNELKARVDWMHQELLWKLTLQENAILAGIDPSVVRWRQWKDEYISHVKYRPKGNDVYKLSKRAEFSINVVDLQINPLSRIVTDDRIIQLYVEYSFLQHTGIYLETPSLLKPDSDFSIVYNFKKKFIIEEKEKSARLLADLVKNNESITFTVVSEPLPNHHTIQTCVDLGSCQLNMFELVQNDGDELSKYFTINDNWDDGEIGRLRIDVSGIFSMRSLALRTLTPEHFTIIR